MTRIDKSQLAMGEPKRIRSPAHLEFVRQQKCCVWYCFRRPVEAHHLLQGRGGHLRAGDDRAIPLCAEHHRGQDSPHALGSEAAWQERHELDLPAIAQLLWARSPSRKP